MVTLSFGFTAFLGYLTVQLMNDVVDILVAGFELHSPSSLLSTAFAVLLVRMLARLFFAVVPQYLTLFRRMIRAVQHVRFGPG